MWGTSSHTPNRTLPKTKNMNPLHFAPYPNMRYKVQIFGPLASAYRDATGVKKDYPLSAFRYSPTPKGAYNRAFQILRVTKTSASGFLAILDRHTGIQTKHYIPSLEVDTTEA